MISRLPRDFSACCGDQIVVVGQTGGCEAFIEANEADLNAVDQDYSQSGHDFWLTRNRHGAGFWDRYYGDNKELRAAYDRLSDASKVYGECNLYVGYDEKIHIS